MFLTISIDRAHQKQPAIGELMGAGMFYLEKITSPHLIDPFGPGSPTPSVGLHTRRSVELDREAVRFGLRANLEGPRFHQRSRFIIR